MGYFIYYIERTASEYTDAKIIWKLYRDETAVNRREEYIQKPRPKN